jgi:hypothetical protein
LESDTTAMSARILISAEIANSIESKLLTSTGFIHRMN